MSSIEKKPLRRLWSKGKEGVYLVSSNNAGKVSTPSVTPRINRKSNTRASVKSNSSKNSYTLEEDDETKTDQQSVSSNSSINASLLSEEESLADEDYLWESLSVDGGTVRLLSSQRKTSLALDQILLDMKTPENNQTDEDDEYADVDVKAIAAAISGRHESGVSELDSDSDTSTAVSEGSDEDDATSDEESDEESDHEDFDMNYHVNKLVKGGSESESESESNNDSDSDGNESAASKKLFQKAVQKVMKKFKRERAQDIVESDLESTLTTEKGSETEESPTSEDSESETSDQGQDPSDESSRETNPKIVKPGGSESVIDPIKMNENEPINSVPEEAKNEGAPKKGEEYSAKAEVPLKENEKTQEGSLAPTLEERNAQDLRWPFSNFYVKEFNQDLEMPLSDNEEALPSYKSTLASAAHPGRKRNVMLGRVWWVEWWAKEENKFHTL